MNPGAIEYQKLFLKQFSGLMVVKVLVCLPEKEIKLRPAAHTVAIKFNAQSGGRVSECVHAPPAPQEAAGSSAAGELVSGRERAR